MSTFHSVKQAIFHCVHISQYETRNRPLCPPFSVWNQATSHCVQPSQCGNRQPPIVSHLHSVEPGNQRSCAESISSAVSPITLYGLVSFLKNRNPAETELVVYLQPYHPESAHILLCSPITVYEHLSFLKVSNQRGTVPVAYLLPYRCHTAWIRLFRRHGTSHRQGPYIDFSTLLIHFSALLTDFYHHFYTHDTQLLTSTLPENVHTFLKSTYDCYSVIKNWMTQTSTKY